MDLKQYIRTIPDHPKPGIMFRDITTLIKQPVPFNYVIDSLAQRYRPMQLDAVAGIESRGFIFGAVLASRLGIPFIPIRKKGKLPAETISQEYQLEYGTDAVEVHVDALEPNSRIVMVDDLIATGGTLLASCQLVEKLSAHVVECACIIDLPELQGKEKLAPRKIFTMVDFAGH